MNIKMTFPTEVTINDTYEVFVNITDYVPYRPAKLSGHPDTWQPPEGGELEFFFSWHDDEQPSEFLDWAINKEDYDRIERECWDYIETMNSQEY